VPWRNQSLEIAHKYATEFRRWSVPGIEQREVLILVGASGLSYDDVAAVSDCPIGTIARRVSRAHLHRMVRRDTPADGECLEAGYMSAFSSRWKRSLWLIC
jgi:hypothetical protein